MMNSSYLTRLLWCALLIVAPCATTGAASQPAPSGKDLPLSTNSEDARRAFEGGLENIENQQTRRAQIDFRSAVRADSNFALAHLFLAYDNGNPSEVKDELDKAQALAVSASKPEQLMIKWIAGSREGQMVPAIAAMNDLIAAYPEDKFVLFLAGRWMVQQKNFESGQHLLERAVAVDSNYPAAFNELGYAYAGTYNFDRAFDSLNTYLRQLPGEPNTEDSYGEISRMAGRYDQALAHYRKALEYDPAFIWSQVGLADTYMMMGDEDRARAEYAKAIAAAPSVGDRLTWQISSALTYAYANDTATFFQSMQSVADEAHALHVGAQEATSYRFMAMYARDSKDVMEYGRKAEAVISRDTGIIQTDNDQQLASILRTEAIHTAMTGDTSATKEALEELRLLAENSRSGFVQVCSEGAQGGVLWVQKKYADAIPHLEEDQSNPLSAARLVRAYRATGDHARAEELLAKLHQYHEPTIEDLLARRLLNERAPGKETRQLSSRNGQR